tara:strand:+ start:4206 stop:5537 length:1332 start_codon:yes stop_codon:yes gene_type:complete
MINTKTQSTLLLTSYFSKPAKDSAKPLTSSEWGRFAFWLNEQGRKPEDLITGDPREVLQGWSDTKIPLERIEQLLERGTALALALDKWSRAGIWVLTRGDADYPRTFKQRLGTSSPAVLFGCGNARLLNQQGVSVVGSRNASTIDLNDANALGRKIAEAGLSVVSGGARGVDEEAMKGGLISEGTVIGVMADSLLGAATASKWRKGLMADNLVLVSPFYPEAGFSPGNAMARNKYIYCLGQAAVVVHSGSKGGTWTGAVENLKKTWVPLWVKKTEDSAAGNQALVGLGGEWIEKSIGQLDVNMLLPHNRTAFSPASGSATSPPLSLTSPLDRSSSFEENPASVCEDELKLEGNAPENLAKQSGFQGQNKHDLAAVTFYQLFLHKMQEHSKPVTVEELMEEWDLSKKPVEEWLKRALDERKVKKLSKPVRYQVITASQLGLGLS